MNAKNTRPKSHFDRLDNVELINTLEMLNEFATLPEQDSQSRVLFQELLAEALVVASGRPGVLKEFAAAVKIDSDPGIKSLFDALTPASPTPPQGDSNPFLKFGKRTPTPSRGGETPGEKDSFYKPLADALSRDIKKHTRRGSAQFFNGVIATTIFFIFGALLIWILNGGF